MTLLVLGLKKRAKKKTEFSMTWSMMQLLWTYNVITEKHLFQHFFSECANVFLMLFLLLKVKKMFIG